MNADEFAEAMRRAREAKEGLRRAGWEEWAVEPLLQRRTIRAKSSPGAALADPVQDLCSRYDVSSLEVGQVTLGIRDIFKHIDPDTLTHLGLELMGMEEGDLLVRDVSSGVVKSVEFSDPTWTYNVYATESSRFLDALAIAAAFMPPFLPTSPEKDVEGDEAIANCKAATEAAAACARAAGIPSDDSNPYVMMLPTYTRCD